MITVLILASSPLDRGQLHLGKEAKLVKHTLDSARNREQFRVVSCMATTPDDLRSYLLEYSPTVVHFCGHGTGVAGLCFEDPDGNTQVVSGSSLAKLFHLVSGDVKCVVLNACFSDEQARPVSEEIDFVIGMRDAIDDGAALKFAEGFYQAVWAGQSFERAFKFGCSAIDTAGLPDEQIPILLRSPRLGGQSLAYDERVQQIENFLLRYVNSSPQERVALTVEGTSIADLLREHYKRIRIGKWSAVTVVGSEEVDEGVIEVDALIQGDAGVVEHTYYLERSEHGLLLFWKAAVGYWKTPARTLLALGTTEVITARVIASLNDYYNYGYEPEDYVSVQMHDPEGESISGFLARNNPQFRDIVTLLHDGQAHRVTLLLRLGRPGMGIAELIGLVSATWVVRSEGSEAA